MVTPQHPENRQNEFGPVHMHHGSAGVAGLLPICLWSADAHAQVISGPIASALLLADGAGGLKGWQWLFLIEGVPTILFGVWVRHSLVCATQLISSHDHCCIGTFCPENWLWAATY